MAKTKGNLIIFLKKRLREIGKEAEDKFIQKLDPDVLDVYRSTLMFYWVPVEKMAKIIEAVAPVLYPSDPKAIMKLGREFGQNNLTTVYRVFLRFTTVPFLIEKAAKFWKLYNDKGNVKVVRREGENTALLLVEDYPDLPESMRELSGGFILSSLEITNAKNIQIARDDRDPVSWKWKITWK